MQLDICNVMNVVNRYLIGRYTFANEIAFPRISEDIGNPTLYLDIWNFYIVTTRECVYFNPPIECIFQTQYRPQLSDLTFTETCTKLMIAPRSCVVIYK